jgi:hypothetical protein
MKLRHVSENCLAVLNERNRVCDANTGLINLGGGVAIDTQSDLPHARQPFVALPICHVLTAIF